MIVIEKLSKSFGRLEVLKNVDLTVREGEKIAIIGPSGCGKSVLLRLIELLETPDCGRILIDGDEITQKGANIDQIRRKMGMVYQNFNLFTHLDVMANLCLAPIRLNKIPRPEAEARALQMLKQVSLESHAHAMPATLSGGQKQRIAIARCLMMSPKVMLFDEPTSALDPTMVGEVLATIRALAKQGMTMLIVTHEMSFAREVADRVLYLDEKGICEQGSPEQIFDHPQKEKTRAFIRKLRFFAFHIDRRDFDLLRMQGGIQTFCEKYGIDGKSAGRLQLCTEELVYALLLKNADAVDMDVSIEYGETTGKLTLEIRWVNEEYNPFEDDALPEGAELGVTILKRIASKLDFRYHDGINHFSIMI